MKRKIDPVTRAHFANIKSVERCWRFADITYRLYRNRDRRGFFSNLQNWYHTIYLAFWCSIHLSRSRMVLDIYNMHKITSPRVLYSNGDEFMSFTYFLFREIVRVTQGRAYLRAIDPERKGGINGQ